MKIQLGHSPDADDAFMFYALAHNRINTAEFQFEHILRDIETLNRWALEKKLEVTALSVHAYAYVSKDYALLPHGASIGEKYGPIVVAMEKMPMEILKQKRIAVPGELTTAFLALCLCLGRFQYEVIPFDQIFDAVRGGKVDAGLIIHEGQLTYREAGLINLLDFGKWWKKEKGLPLPLGVDVVRRDLGEKKIAVIYRMLKESIEYALEPANRPAALEYALKFGRGIAADLADKFIGMYVNHYTVDFGDRGRHAVRKLLAEAQRAGLIPAISRSLFSDETEVSKDFLKVSH